MAKSKSIFNIQGTLQGITFVNSKLYGDHLRAARGTHKPATVNEALQQSTSRLVMANLPAKIIKDALEPYREHFKGGLLWQRLLSQFRKQLKHSGIVDFSAIEPVEVHEDYPLSRFIQGGLQVQYDAAQHMMHIHLSYGQHPKPKHMKYMDGYRVGVIGIFPDLELQKATSTVVYSPVISLKGEYAPLDFALPIPANASAYLLCVKFEGYEGKVACNKSVNMGMRIEKAGMLTACM